MVRNRVDGEHSAAIFGAELRQPNNFQHDFKMAEFPIVETLVPPRMQGGICNRRQTQPQTMCCISMSMATNSTNIVRHKHHKMTMGINNTQTLQTLQTVGYSTTSRVIRHEQYKHRKHLMTLVRAELCHLMVRFTLQIKLQLLLQLLRLWRRWLTCGYVCRWDHGSGCHIVKHATCSEVMLSETGKCAKSRWDFIC